MTGDKTRGRNGRYTRTTDSIERDAEVVRLRAQQLTFTEIAARMEYTHASAAKKAYERGIAAIIRPPAEAAVKAEVTKLDALERAAWEVLRKEHLVVSHGRIMRADGEDGEPGAGPPLLDDGPLLAAIDRVLKVADRRAKLLGLDTPVKVDATVHQVDARDAELLEMVNEARAQRAVEQSG